MIERIIPLTNGKVAIVDAEDFELLSKFSWSFDGEYAKRNPLISQNETKQIRMHRQIVTAPTGYFIDHINGNKLDNRKENLRAVTIQQNTFNSKGHKDSFSKRKGVSWSKEKQRWYARIYFCGRKRFLGYFDDKEKAAEVYDKAALELFGEYAKLNNTAGGF